jgi:hypothetical protein
MLMDDLKEKFSVQCRYINPEEKRMKRFGNMWFDVSGDIVGDVDAVQLIGLAGDFFKNVLARRQDCIDKSLFRLTPIDVLEEIEKRIAMSSSQSEAVRWESYFLAPGCGPSMDGEVLIWLIGIDRDRLIWKRFGTEGFVDAYLPAGWVGRILEEFVRAVA